MSAYEQRTGPHQAASVGNLPHLGGLHSTSPQTPPPHLQAGEGCKLPSDDDVAGLHPTTGASIGVCRHGNLHETHTHSARHRDPHSIWGSKTTPSVQASSSTRKHHAVGRPVEMGLSVCPKQRQSNISTACIRWCDCCLIVCKATALAVVIQHNLSCEGLMHCVQLCTTVLFPVAAAAYFGPSTGC